MDQRQRGAKDWPCRVIASCADHGRSHFYGGVAQLVEHLFCTQAVEGSNPSSSTIKAKLVMVELTSKERVYLTNCDLYKIQVKYVKKTGNQHLPLSVSEFIELEELSLIANYFKFLCNGCTRNGNGPRIVCDSVEYYIRS